MGGGGGISRTSSRSGGCLRIALGPRVKRPKGTRPGSCAILESSVPAQIVDLCRRGDEAVSAPAGGYRAPKHSVRLAWRRGCERPAHACRQRAARFHRRRSCPRSPAGLAASISTSQTLSGNTQSSFSCLERSGDRRRQSMGLTSAPEGQYGCSRRAALSAASRFRVLLHDAARPIIIAEEQDCDCRRRFIEPSTHAPRKPRHLALGGPGRDELCHLACRRIRDDGRSGHSVSPVVTERQVALNPRPRSIHGRVYYRHRLWSKPQQEPRSETRHPLRTGTGSAPLDLALSQVRDFQQSS